jgi:hypothetical protein
VRIRLSRNSELGTGEGRRTPVCRRGSVHCSRTWISEYRTKTKPLASSLRASHDATHSSIVSIRTNSTQLHVVENGNDARTHNSLARFLSEKIRLIAKRSFQKLQKPLRSPYHLPPRLNRNVSAPILENTAMSQTTNISQAALSPQENASLLRISARECQWCLAFWQAVLVSTLNASDSHASLHVDLQSAEAARFGEGSL